jgi:SAM-dependent methyltransferase
MTSISSIKFTEQEIQKVVQNKTNYPDCKLKEYIAYKNAPKLTKYFKHITSRQQLKALVNIANNECSGYLQPYGNNITIRLIHTLCRTSSLKHIIPIINKIKNSKNDDQVYTFLRNKFSRILRKDCKAKLKLYCHPSLNLAQDVIYLLSNVKRKITTYLDIGCGTGKKAEYIAKELNILPKNTYGADVDSFDEQGTNWNKKAKKCNINFVPIKENERYPFKNGKFDMISAFMVLHHIPNIEFALKEVHRLLRKNGLFIIKEHDCYNAADVMLADVEHCMYSLVYSRVPDRDFRHKDYATYFNHLEWDCILLRYGFKFVKDSFSSASVHFNVSPSRGYLAVYKKI